LRWAAYRFIQHALLSNTLPNATAGSRVGVVALDFRIEALDFLSATHEGTGATFLALIYLYIAAI
jgi:hypothetical protein